MILGSIIGVACLLSIAVLLGFLAKKQWKSYDEYLSAKETWAHGLRDSLSRAPTFRLGLLRDTAVVYKVGFAGMWFGGIWSLVGIIPTVWLAATKTREFSSKLGAATITETIGRRFESKGLHAPQNDAPFQCP